MEIDVHSRTWRRVIEFADDRIRMHQVAIEQAGLDHGQTEFHRGAIRDLRLLLQLTAESKEFPAFSTHIERAGV